MYETEHRVIIDCYKNCNNFHFKLDSQYNWCHEICNPFPVNLGMIQGLLLWTFSSELNYSFCYNAISVSSDRFSHYFVTSSVSSAP